MSRCPICDNKPANCDCTPGDREAHEQREAMEEIGHKFSNLMMVFNDIYSLSSEPYDDPVKRLECIRRRAFDGARHAIEFGNEMYANGL